MGDIERQDVIMATLYELRLRFSNADKVKYSTDEIIEVIDRMDVNKD